MTFDIRTKTTDYMSIVVTNECNRHCPFCIDIYRGTGTTMSQQTFNTAMEVAQEHSVKDVLFVGGEPTLHPDLSNWVRTAKNLGFHTIVTTNFDNLDAVYALDGIADSLNLSYYGQKVLPDPERFTTTDLTLSCLLYRTGRIRSKADLDAFIDLYGASYQLKFSTLTQVNAFTARNSDASWLDTLDADPVILFDEIEGLVYRGTVIKRYDRVVNASAYQSIKVHANGVINRSWDRTENLL